MKNRKNHYHHIVHGTTIVDLLVPETSPNKSSWETDNRSSWLTRSIEQVCRRRAKHFPMFQCCPWSDTCESGSWIVAISWENRTWSSCRHWSPIGTCKEMVVVRFAADRRRLPQRIFGANDGIDQNSPKIVFVDIGDERDFLRMITVGVGYAHVHRIGESNDVRIRWDLLIVAIGPVGINMIFQVNGS